MVYLFLGDGFEEAEAICPADILIRCGVDVKTVSVMSDNTVVGAHGIKIIADLNVNDVKDNAEMYIMPGGMGGVDNLSKSVKLREILKNTTSDIAAICADPTLLADIGLLENKKAICYPSMTNELRGANVVFERVVSDGRFVTSMGPGTSFEFGFELARRLKGDEIAAKVKEAMLVK
ncbi:MAG: DJ-1/PfpI family protein [Clostridia bacterium]|nr:DJ-1/PfpI family protein [Clostridia bacterium]